MQKICAGVLSEAVIVFVSSQPIQRSHTISSGTHSCMSFGLM